MADEAAERYTVAREALAQLAMPVAIIGAEADGKRSCATGTAMYVSFSPPRIAIAQHPGSHTTALVEASGRFSVSLLRDDQLEAAMAAGRGSRTDDKFVELGVEPLIRPGRAPAVAGSAAILWCEVSSVSEAGDHRLFIGTVTEYEVGSGARQLLRHRRRYAALGSYLSDEAPEGYPT